MRAFAPAPLPCISGRVHWKTWLKQLLSSGSQPFCQVWKCLALTSFTVIIKVTTCSMATWSGILTHFYADFTILILCLECIFLSFLLCVTAIKNINLLCIFTVQIQCLLAHFMFLWQFQHGVANWTFVAGSFVPLLHPLVVWLCPGVAQCPTEADWLSQKAIVFLSGEPWNTATWTP